MRVIKRKNTSTKTSLILIFICGLASIPMKDVVAATVSGVSQLMVLSLFTISIISFCAISIIIAVKKKEPKKLTLAFIPIIAAFLILRYPQDLPYVIAVILLFSLFAVSVIRGPEPVKVSK